MNDADRHFYSSSNCEMCPVCGAKVKKRMKSKIYNSGYFIITKILIVKECSMIIL